jgi:hypothetical protein
VHQPPSFDAENTAEHAHPIPDLRVFLVNLYRQATTKTVGTYNHLQYLGHFDAMNLSRTKYFNCLELVVPLLYWYTAYHAMLNDTKAVICPCELSNGLILVALWLTRCNKPVVHAITYNRETNTCEMIKKGWLSFLQEPSLLDLTEGLLDAIYKFYIFIRYILITKFVFRSYKVFIHLNRWQYNPDRGLHQDCKTPQLPDHQLTMYKLKNNESTIASATEDSTDGQSVIAKTKKQQKKEQVSQAHQVVANKKRSRAPSANENNTSIIKITKSKKSPKPEVIVVPEDDAVDNRDATIRQQEERILQLEQEATNNRKLQHVTSNSEIGVKATTTIVPVNGPSVVANASNLPNTSTLLNGVAQSSSFGNFILLHHELTVKLLQAQHALERAEKEKRDASDRAFLAESSINLNKQLSLSGFNVGL